MDQDKQIQMIGKVLSTTSLNQPQGNTLSKAAQQTQSNNKNGGGASYTYNPMKMDKPKAKIFKVEKDITKYL